jgi:hypothetical protein
MAYSGKRTAVQARRKPVLRRSSLAVALVLLGLLGVLVPAGALDYTGRIDTRYLFRAGDNAFGNNVYNYHSLELSLFTGLTFSWYGGVIASLNPTVNSYGVVNTLDGTTELSDNALRNLQDAGNPGQYVNYTLYSAFVKYNAGIFGATLGRCNPADYDLIRFDGLFAWAQPLDWLRVEAFGGLPWHYAFISNPSDILQSWTSGELAAGGGVDLTFLDEALKFSVKYLYLQEATASSGLIGSTSSTYMSADSLTKAYVSWSGWDWLNAGAGATAFDLSPLGANAWVSGTIEFLHLSYYADFQSQFIDVSAISDRLTQFAAILTSSNPYLDGSVSLTEELGAFFLPQKGFLTGIELELTYEHRQPVYASDLSMFNPQYDQFRIGTLLGANGGWTMQLFYSLLLTSGVQNTLHVVGGEIGRKWDAFDIRLGSSFNASQYQTDYTQTVLQDSFYAQEYYLRGKWQINRSFDVSLRAAYENILLTSITSGQPLNTDVTAASLSTLNDTLRNYFRVDLRAGFRY